MTDSRDRGVGRGWVLYDAHCSLCTALLARWQTLLRAEGFEPEPLQSPWARERLKLPEDLLLTEMRVLTREGQILGGADALVFLTKLFAPRRRPLWAWMLVSLSNLPFALPIWRWVYRWVAARRSCASGSCAIGWLSERGNALSKGREKTK